MSFGQQLQHCFNLEKAVNKTTETKQGTKRYNRLLESHSSWLLEMQQNSGSEYQQTTGGEVTDLQFVPN